MTNKETIQEGSELEDTQQTKIFEQSEEKAEETRRFIQMINELLSGRKSWRRTKRKIV